MKIALSSFLLSALLLLGCNETPIQPEEPKILEDQSYEIIQIPPRATGGPSFSATEIIDGSKGGYIKIKESYITVDGDTVKIDVKLKIKKDCFSGSEDITMTLDDVYTAVKLTPPMDFDKPVELDVKYKGLDPDQMILTSGNYEFLYIDDDGNSEIVPSYGVVVKQEVGEISVKKAKL
ncbi:MAG: hypothetical protein IH784_10725, partial [Bacteroidetes bacterium]|nr:hypothetical protein [Bacteroidota bacterium]